jgi:hypothetical protein
VNLLVILSTEVDIAKVLRMANSYYLINYFKRISFCMWLRAYRSLDVLLGGLLMIECFNSFCWFFTEHSEEFVVLFLSLSTVVVRCKVV